MLGRYNAKSHGGLCLDYIQLYYPKAVNPAVLSGGIYILPLDEQYDDEQFHFIKDTAQFTERPVEVEGAIMWEAEITMLIAGDDQSRYLEIERIRRKKWAIRFKDRSHTDKIIGHPTGAYASLIINERRGGIIRSDRREISVTWRALLPEPVGVYRF
jgi:hypothetical protein